MFVHFKLIKKLFDSQSDLEIDRQILNDFCVFLFVLSQKFGKKVVGKK